MRPSELSQNGSPWLGYRKHLVGAALLAVAACQSGYGQTPDPNFQIYLAFGQSNMEGNATPEAQDKTGASERFKILQAVECSALGRKKNTWVTGNAPNCRCNTGLNPVDYFGRTMADSLPANIKIGVINVAVAGCAIEMFDKDKYKSYVAGEASWMQSIANEYGGNPYARLVELAKLAQKDGVIKGFLLHQGESGSKSNNWAGEVKIVYNNLIQDLGLDASKTPLLVGDLVRPSSMIQNLPQTLPNSYVISSNGLKDRGDGLHFNAPSYRDFGKRYAQTMLTILAKEPAPTTVRGQYDLATSPTFQAGATSISFAIPSASFVSIKAYDLHGKELTQLASGHFTAGSHQINLNRTDALRGAHVLVLQTPELTFSKEWLGATK